MTPERLARFTEVVSHRQSDLTVVLENIHDEHNIGAVLRSCDAVGVYRLFLLYTDRDLRRKNIALGKRTSAGARRWMEVQYYELAADCFAQVRQHSQRVLAAALHEDATALYSLDLTQPTALVFGNEHAGISPEALHHCDGSFLIPMLGMTRSLNVSVACAVSLYEACRQRTAAGQYGSANPTPVTEQQRLLADYLERHAAQAERNPPLPGRDPRR